MTGKRTPEHSEDEAAEGVRPKHREPPAAPAPEPQELQRRLAASSSALVVLAVATVLTVCYFAKLPIIVLLVAILLAFILAPLADLFQRLKMPRSLASGLAVCAFLAVLYGIGAVSYNRAVAFGQDLPKYSEKIRQIVSIVRKQAQRIEKTTQTVLPPEAPEPTPQPQPPPVTGRRGQPAQAPPAAPTTTTVTVQQQRNWLDYLTSGLGPVTEIVFAASFIPFLTYFMLSWQDHVRSSTVMLFRMKNRNTAYVTLGLISGMIRSFIVGNVLVGLFISAASTVVFGFLHLPYFYFLGFISGFLSLVPYLGVLLAVVPPLIAGVGQVHSTGAIVIVATVLGLHLFALNVLYPKFLGSRLQLNPLAVTLFLLFWGWMWGAMGLVLAVPMTAAMKIVFDHVESLRGIGAWLGE